ncbi:transglycosylase SLT domain-containing protein [Acetobacteraceae bacterium H6797]|nr:transglycosylase SLT domain-containing protein [Acetobacteraceae bacterium H6797]
MIRLIALLAPLLLALPAKAQFGAPLPPAQACRAAIAVAEREKGIPSGLLQAIGRVESGRRDPETGQFAPWPWVINAEGTGRFFQSKAEAIAAVRQLQTQGVRLIDVGCLQINLVHHPDAFPNLEEAFDPLANARYGAKFLSELRQTRPDWMTAAGNYHSNTPERAASYRAAVAAALPGEQMRLASNPPSAWSGVEGGAGMGMGGSRGWPASSRGMAAAAGGGMPARAPSSERGRGLDSYRSMPIVPVSRLSPLAMRRG